MKVKAKFFLSILFLLLFVNPIFANDRAFGSFRGRVLAIWLRDELTSDREMQLVEEFEYIDPQGNSWRVPEGSVVDGASIPKVFWQIIGSPFIGNYREASVVHDYFCKKKSRPWKEVHRMFYHASLANGVPKIKAQLMYAAVYAGGPRWQIVSDIIDTSGDTVRSLPNPPSSGGTRGTRGLPQPRIPGETTTVDVATSYNEAALEKELEIIETEELNLEEIEARIDAIVTEQTPDVTP